MRAYMNGQHSIRDYSSKTEFVKGNATMNQLVIDRRLRALSRAGVVALAAVLLLMLPAPARAQTSASETFYDVAGFCVSASAQISPFYLFGSPLGLTSTTTISVYTSCPGAVVGKIFAPCWAYPDEPCGGVPVPIPTSLPVQMAPGTLDIFQMLYLDNGNGTLTWCSTPASAVVNSQTQDRLTATAFNLATVGACGAGNYKLYSFAYAFDGQVWRGGLLTVGDVYMM